MSTPQFSNWAEKNRPAFWWIYTCLGRGIFHGPILCLCGAVFEVGYPPRRGFQKGGSGAKALGGNLSEPVSAPASVGAGRSPLGSSTRAGRRDSPANCARRTAERSACPADSRNRQKPYRDTVENGSTLGKSDIHDTQFDAMAPKPTPKNRKIDAMQNSRSGRLCRPL